MSGARACLFLSALLCAARLAAAAGAPLSARMRAEPARPYAGEDFSLVLEVTAAPGSEISLTGLAGLPQTLPLAIESFSAAGVREGAASDGNPVHIYSFTAAARAAKAFDFRPQVVASLSTTERQNNGFFSGVFTRTRTVPVVWPRLEVRALPEEGRPADFSGAVGRFRMRLEAAPVEVMPQDIVELRLTLEGTGFLGDASPVPPALDAALFKTYPPTVRRDVEGARLVLRQSVIPLSTNAVEIAPAAFSFFDAAAGVYTNVQTAPVRLVFRKRDRMDAPAVREVKVDAPRREEEDAGLDVSKYLALSRAKASVTVARQTALRVAPGPQAKMILAVPAGSGVVPLEAARGWVRVKALGRTGWLDARDVE